jgi:hypothetical protein
MSEHDEQKALIDWCFYHLAQYPELDLIHAIPNGVMLGGGKVGAMRMNMLKAEGLRPGVCDLFLPCARGGYFGLYIEMKDYSGRLSDNQKEFIAGVEKQGFLCYVPYGANEAISLLQKYLDMPKTKAKVKNV